MADADPPRSAFPRYSRFEMKEMPSPMHGQTHYQHRVPGDDGMTLRDWFASCALVSLLWVSREGTAPLPLPTVCAACYAVADEMLRASARPPSAPAG